jgi:hypothetical protein
MLADFFQAKVQISIWLELNKGSSWDQILEQVQIKHPDFDRTAQSAGKQEAEKCVVAICFSL